MEAVYSDLRLFLKRNTFPSRTVLIFPPFNGFRRFLIHKLIEDHFASSEVAAFSIGEDIARRIVVCYKGLIREGQNKSLPSCPAAPDYSMIEKEKPRQRSSPAAAVYKPPAARLADSKNSKDVTKPSDSKRVRRPDQQMYVPRPKRASFGSEEARSRRHSSSRASLDSCDNSEESRIFETNATSLSDSCKSTEVGSTTQNDQHHNISIKTNTLEKCNDISKLESAETSNSSSVTVVPIPEELLDRLARQLDESSSKVGHSDDQTPQELPDRLASQLDESSSKVGHSDDQTPEELPDRIVSQLDESSSKVGHSDDQLLSEMEVDCCDCDSKVMDSHKSSSKEDNCIMNDNTNCFLSVSKDSLNKSPNQNNSPETTPNLEIGQSDSREELTCSQLEHMDTISISSESRSGTTSSSYSKSSSSSSDSENVESHDKYKKDNKIDIGTSSSLNVSTGTKSGSSINNSKQQDLKSLMTISALPVSDVLVISDTSSSSDGIESSTTAKKTECSAEQVKKPKVTKASRKEKHKKKSQVVVPDDCDWESLYDDSGECLVPSLMEELTDSVGKVRIASVDNDYRAYQSVEERTNDGECVIEIYDFPSEFKTTDLFNIFAAYRNRNFQIKWVDDTHALGVFPCPLIADEVLACTLPFVKTRPLRLGIAESRLKARNLVLPALPAMERPKTCTALARRLVSGALGLRLPTSSQDREKEKQMLKEAREKRRLEAKQRDAAWNGTLTSDNSC